MSDEKKKEELKIKFLDSFIEMLHSKLFDDGELIFYTHIPHSLAKHMHTHQIIDEFSLELLNDPEIG